MTTREKVLLGLMGIALVCGAVQTSFSTFSQLGFSYPAPQTTQQHHDVITEATAVLHALPLPQAQRTILEHALQPIVRSPFVNQQSTVGQRSSSDSGTLPRYTGFMELGAVRLAIIDGQEYRLGERLPETHDVIEHIDSQHVRLFSPLRNTTWRLPYQGEPLHAAPTP